MFSNAVASLETSASAAVFDKPSALDCTAPVLPFKKPDTRAFVQPRLDYIEFFSQYTRSPYNAAKLYSYLVFHAQRNKPGANPARLEVIRDGGPWGERAYWWVQRRKDIAASCHLTEDQFRGAMEVLERAKVAEHRRGRYTGRLTQCCGKTVSHIRLGICQRGNGLDSWPTTEQMAQMRTVPGGAKPPLSSGAKPPALVQDALTETQDALIATAYKPANDEAVALNMQAGLITAPGKTKTKKAKHQICKGSADASFDAVIEVERRYGGDHALGVCKQAGFIPQHWTMLPKDACEAILAIADALAVAHPSYSWEDIVLAFGPQQAPGWDRLNELCDAYEAKPYLAALRKRMPSVLEWLGPDATLLPDPDAPDARLVMYPMTLASVVRTGTVATAAPNHTEPPVQAVVAPVIVVGTEYVEARLADSPEAIMAALRAGWKGNGIGTTKQGNPIYPSAEKETPPTVAPPAWKPSKSAAQTPKQMANEMA